MWALLLRPQVLVGAAVAVAFALLLLALQIQKNDYRRLENTFAVAKAQWAEQEAERERVARAQAEANAALQLKHAAQTQELVREHAVELAGARTAAHDADLRADELQHRLDENGAADGHSGADADAAACGGVRDRAAAVRDVLAGAQRLATKFAGAAEKHAGEVRLLKKQVLADRAACNPEKQ